MTTINALNERIIKLQDKQIKDLEKARELDKELHAAELKHTVDLYSGAVAHVAAERDIAIEVAEDYKQDVQHWQAQAEREHNAFVQAAEERDKAIRDKMDLRKRLTGYSRQNKKLTEDNESLQAAFEAQLIATDIVDGQKDRTVKELEKALTKQASLEQDVKLMASFINNICEMVACDAELSDIAEECIQWRQGEWTPTDSIEDMVGSIIDEDPGSFFGGSDEVVEDMKADSQCCGAPSDKYKWKVLVVEHKGEEAVFTGFYSNYDLARESVDLMVARGCYEAWVEEMM